MGSKKFAVVSNEKLKELLFALFQHYVVIAPIRELPEKSPILAKLDENDLERLELNDRALVPFKFSFQPLRDTLFTYTFNKNVVNISYEIKEEKRLLLLGLRGCELKALEITDLVMLEDPADPFYKVRRENTILISLDCVNPFSSCFCTELGGKPYPEKGYDLNLSPVEGGYLIEVGSLKGWELLKPLQLFFSEPGEQCLLQRNKQREESYTKLKSFYSKPLKELSKVDENFFTNFSKKCVECSGCIYTCPTCYCFHVSEEKQNNLWRRLRTIDSCLFEDFQRVAAGVNPRATLNSRLRQRFLHKFVYFKERYGVYGCVGCGRCFNVCPGEIDIREVIGLV